MAVKLLVSATMLTLLLFAGKTLGLRCYLYTHTGSGSGSMLPVDCADSVNVCSRGVGTMPVNEPTNYKNKFSISAFFGYCGNCSVDQSTGSVCSTCTTDLCNTAADPQTEETPTVTPFAGKTLGFRCYFYRHTGSGSGSMSPVDCADSVNVCSRVVETMPVDDPTKYKNNVSIPAVLGGCGNCSVDQLPTGSVCSNCTTDLCNTDADPQTAVSTTDLRNTAAALQPAMLAVPVAACALLAKILLF